MLGKLSSHGNLASSSLSLHGSGLLVVNDGKQVLQESLVLGVQVRDTSVAKVVEVTAVSVKSAAEVGLVGVGTRVDVTISGAEVIEHHEIIASVDARVQRDTLGLGNSSLGCGQTSSVLFRAKNVR